MCQQQSLVIRLISKKRDPCDREVLLRFGYFGTVEVVIRYMQ
jgi:hypothetical protein